MATNKYFNNFGFAREQDLLEDLAIESIKIYGHNFKYIPRTVVERDDLFGESVLSKFEAAADLEMYVKNTEGFDGDGDFLSKFGLEIRDSMTLTVARKRYDQIRTEKVTTEVGFNLILEDGDNNAPSRRYLTGDHETESLELETATADGYSITQNRPTEGDLIYMPLMDKLFEIKFVEHEAVFYQTGRLQTYDLRCELFEYSSERLDTGITEIDSVEDELSLDILEFELSLEDNLPVALGTAALTGNTVSSVSITDGGLYTSAPTVTFSAPTTPISDQIKFGTNSLEHSAVTDKSEVGRFTSGITLASGVGVSIKFFIRPTSFLGGQNVSILHTDKFKIHHNSSTGRIEFTSSFGTGFAGPNLTLNQWNFVQIDLLNTTGRLAVNGTFGGTFAHGAGTLISDGDILFAGDADAGDSVADYADRSFLGYLDQIEIDNISSLPSNADEPSTAGTGDVFTATFDNVTATGTAVLTNGVVTSVTITEGGSRYITAPTVTFSNETTSGTWKSEDGGSIMQEYTLETADKQANNAYFQREMDSVIDFSESNPFGEVDRY